ncbi:MAG TPA: Ldh family oxidoreductase, partial [Casimicrobiaceae bacterium]|nr:Ldh family oxidoreductase [Casimicrobiaceae bacterium]
LIDLSLSSSSLGRALAHHRRGKKLAGKWLLDHQGRPTDDPSVLFADPPGSILPLGGSDVGYKGFGLALMVYALSAGLAGYDADDADDANSSAVFLQLIDPDGFGGRLAFRRAISAFADKCRRSPAVPGGVGVRIPGERAEQSRRRAHAEGVELSEDCVEMLERWARTLDVSNVLG